MKGEHESLRNPDSDQGKTGPKLHIVIAYDQADAARWAVRLIDRVAVRFSEELQVQRDLWAFDHFNLASVNKRAAGADIVAICSDASRDLPVLLKRWLENWCGQKAPGSAAIAAVIRRQRPRHPNHEQLPDVIRFLSRTAGNAHLDFFVATLFSKPQSPEPVRESAQPENGKRSWRFTTPADQYWTLNE